MTDFTANPKNNENIVFAVGLDENGDKIVILGISKAAWEFIKEGKTQTFNLMKVGVPFNLIVFGAETQQDVLNLMPLDRSTLDRRNTSFKL